MSGSIHEALQDRMPEVARGTAAWDPTDAAHLAECAECRLEWGLIQGAAAIGRGVEREFDPSPTAMAVTERLRSPLTRLRRRPAGWVIGLATAAAVLVALLRPAGPTASAPGQVVEGRLFPELDSLDVEELTIIADGLDTPLSETPLGAAPTFDELDSTQLTRVLRALEG